MSGETEAHVSGWTVDTWAEHTREVRKVERRLERERDRRYQERFAASQTALTTALNSLNARLDILNELRGGVATESDLDSVKTLLSDLKERVDRTEGKGVGMSLAWGVMLAVATVVISLVVLYANRGG